MNKKYKMIIIEDEPPILASIKDAVKRSNTPFTIEATAFNGKAALGLIEEHKPHVVLTDINMPIMGGLEMIHQAQLRNPNIKFIILTGYNEFEYARTALRLGVSDYILKPVRQKTLNKLLERIAGEIDYRDYTLEAQYIKSELGLLNNSNKDINALDHTYIHMFHVYAGTMIHRPYGDLELERYHWKLKDWEELKEVSLKFCERVHIFRGKHINEIIVVAIWGSSGVRSVDILLDQIFKWAKLDKSFITVAKSKVIKDGEHLRERAIETVDALSRGIRFGKNTVIKDVCEKGLSEQKISGTVKEEIKELTFMTTEEQLTKKLKRMVELWNREDYAQEQLVKVIDYLFTSVEEKLAMQIDNFYYKRLESDQLLVSADNYNKLYKNILNELKKMLSLYLDDIYEGSGARELVNQIQKYLDKHFASSITYKTLEDKFGYNEKYISNIFKEEKGISPSKYITSLRIDMAKKLMIQNPDTLIKDIARAVGYPDQLYFSRVFKEIVGETPSRFLKNNN